MDRSRIAIIIPAFNEEQTIASVVLAAKPWGVPIVINDGSSDDTASKAKEAGAEVRSHDVNSGYDTALNTGFAAANTLGVDYALTMDADGQHNPTLIPQFIAKLDSGADIVSGVRDRKQRLAEKIFSIVGRYTWGIDDPLCGMKAYSMSLYKDRGYFDSYSSVGTELSIYAVRNNKSLSQVFVETRPRRDHPRFGNRFFANLKIIRALLLAFIYR